MDFLRLHKDGVRLFSMAFLTLYFELALIRYASSEVLYLGYFSNFVLISAFLGIGLGFIAEDRKVDLFRFLPQSILFLITFLAVSHVDVTALSLNAGQLFFRATDFGEKLAQPKIPLWLSLTIIFCMSAFLFTCIAQETARSFKKYSPLVAYSIDIAGSLAGIVLFTVQSAGGASPIYWLAVVFIVVIAASKSDSIANSIMMAVGVLATLFLTEPNHYIEWSPYQKIEVRPVGNQYFLTANGIGHQSMGGPGEKEAIYDFPYTTIKNARQGKGYERALIIGAGSGSDVSYALHYGVKHIDAVEIDPEIQAAGQLFHPSKPYDSEKVSVFVDDGRAFMTHAKGNYDLIIYALPDSLALLSSYSSIRLESFLFTVESFQQARKLLAPDGVLILYNYYREPWLLKKLAQMLTIAFGHPPIIVADVQSKGLLAGLAVGPNLKANSLPEGAENIEPATDDWPFLYMEKRSLPVIYIVVMLLFVLSAFVGVLMFNRKAFAGFKSNGPYFLMGAAFLLLETKSVILFSLLFGATWVVNSLVFFAILVSVLVANWLVHYFKPKGSLWIFAGLTGVLVINYFLPTQTLLNIESVALRYLVSTVVFFCPILLANLAFSKFFSNSDSATGSFGWNILGALTGGTFEYFSLLLGYRNLTVVVTILYLACAVWWYILPPKSQLNRM